MSAGLSGVAVSPGREPKVSQGVISKFVTLFAQLAILVVLVDRFQVENEAFLRLMALTAVGFAIHYFLPFRHRLPFFVALSFIAIGVVLGLEQAAWLIGIGLALIGIATLPLHVYARAALLIAVGGALAIPRWGLGSVPWSAAVWPILGSLFVFRMISYLYDRAHDTAPSRPAQILAYFFLLPNVCFPLFPLIDFKRFCRSYYDSERHGIYQVGIEWIWRGLIQLLAYRLVYFYFTIDPVAVEDLGDLAFYMLSTFFLYVRLSGYFHIVIGVLHLFGFNLPETHHRYFLASSFTDFWRRINIFWKDFMLKVFYYPAYFRLRRFGETRALVIATIFTFAATWFLHLTQWFWIRGSILVEWNDIVFWSLFGTLVLVNSLYETRHGRSRLLQKRERTLAESAGLVFRTLGTFTTICIMWSFWTAESMTDWWLMVTAAMKLPGWSPAQFAALVSLVAAALLLAVYGTWKGWGAGQRVLGPTVAPRTILATSVVLSFATVPMVTESLGASGDAIDSVRLASASHLNRRDAENFQRGYYENLLDVGKFNAELQQRYDAMPTDFVRSLSRLGLSRATNDEQDYELLPLKEGRFAGAMMRTNQWGMRDGDYTRQRPDGTYRFALIGPSTAMGSGVEDDETFEAVVERRLNASAPNPKAYEILNFGVAGYSPLHQFYQLERKVWAFEPNAVIYLGHSTDMDSASTQWISLLRKGELPDEPYFRELADRTGIEPDTGQTEGRRRMKPYARDLLAWTYRQIVQQCRERGIAPVFAYLERVTEPTEPWRAGPRAEVLEVARAAGFSIMDLTGAFEGHQPSELWLMEGDAHANALGNRLIADRLYAGLASHLTARTRPAGEGSQPSVMSSVVLTGSR